MPEPKPQPRPKSEDEMLFQLGEFLKRGESIFLVPYYLRRLVERKYSENLLIGRIDEYLYKLDKGRFRDILSFIPDERERTFWSVLISNFLEGTNEPPNGLEIFQEASEKGIPIILTTGAHHGLGEIGLAALSGFFNSEGQERKTKLLVGLYSFQFEGSIPEDIFTDPRIRIAFFDLNSIAEVVYSLDSSRYDLTSGYFPSIEDLRDYFIPRERFELKNQKLLFLFKKREGDYWKKSILPAIQDSMEGKPFPPRILLIEDDIENIRAAVEILTGSGLNLQITIAINFQDAYGRITHGAEGNFDLVISDIHFPTSFAKFEEEEYQRRIEILTRLLEKSFPETDAQEIIRKAIKYDIGNLKRAIGGLS